MKSIITKNTYWGNTNKKYVKSVNDADKALTDINNKSVGKIDKTIIGRLNLKLPRRHFMPKGILGSLWFSINTIGII